MVSQPQSQQQRHKNRITVEQSISLLYHDIFGYPLKEKELVNWSPGKKMKLTVARPRIFFDSEFFCIAGKQDTIESRKEKEAVSREKMKVLALSKHVFQEEENVLMVGITGSLAMNSASEKSDIDLMIIVKKGTLWSTRLRTLLKLKRLNVAVRRAGKTDQANKLCINMWLDESDLRIENENPYTAHELAQIVPLVNRGGAYDMLLSQNDWILNYWPNSTNIKPHKFENERENRKSLKEWGAYYLQKAYMKRKKTREVVTPTRAFFHPMDWSKKVKLELARRGVEYI